MALVMFIFMRNMYKNDSKNILIIGGSLLVMASATFLVRNQIPIDDVKWEAMIPHHSIALLTSKNADLKDPEVKKLAEDIIEAQERETNQMKQILKRLEVQ